jgi:hypothetical protein
MAKSCHPVRQHIEDLNIHGLTDLDKPVGC